MTARSKRERAARRAEKAAGQRERKTSQRTGARRGLMATAGQAKSPLGSQRV